MYHQLIVKSNDRAPMYGQSIDEENGYVTMQDVNNGCKYHNIKIKNKKEKQNVQFDLFTFVRSLVVDMYVSLPFQFCFSLNIYARSLVNKTKKTIFVLFQNRQRQREREREK